ncbi:MAG: hypothetical protein WB586_28650 [Chthoniobacterales bacterium]
MDKNELFEALREHFGSRGGGRVWDAPIPGVAKSGTFAPFSQPVSGLRFGVGAEEATELAEEREIMNNLGIANQRRLVASDYFSAECWRDPQEPLRLHLGRICECNRWHHLPGSAVLTDWRTMAGRRVTISKREIGRGFAIRKLLGQAEDRVIAHNRCRSITIDRPLYKCAVASNLIAYFT